jgi:cyclic pyranopterin phosphate synthase
MRRKALHVDARGRARMVDVGAKSSTRRVATARGIVTMGRAAFEALSSGKLAKGDALAVARLAGIQAAKRTSEIVPLCHPIALESVEVDVTLDSRRREAVVTATARITGKTGVEMEALTAVSAACLTLYDMIKALDRGAVIKEVLLLEKKGGRSGAYRR